MKYRALDKDGDYILGGGPGEFLVNSPAAVGQAVLTRLLLIQGEWFLDTSIGTPWFTQIIGKNTIGSRNAVIQGVVMNTIGVKSILSFSANYDAQRRALNDVRIVIDTIYGQATINPTG